MLRQMRHLRLRWWLGAAAIVVLCSATTLVMLGADSNSGLTTADRDSIAGVVRDYMVACAATYVVPRELQGQVLSQRQALLDNGIPLQLGAMVIDKIDASYSNALSALGSAAFAQRQLQIRDEHGVCAAATLEKNLNRKDLSPLLNEEFQVVNLEPEGRSEGTAHVNVTMWIGDTRADGSRVESWAVYDYTMVEVDKSWKIDNEVETWAYFDADFHQWGPDSPHDKGESTTG
jgi:hypothetical protein